MERSATRDLVVGLFILAGLGAVAYLSISIGGFAWHAGGRLLLVTRFTETGDMNVRAPVVIAGVRVGEVTKIELNKELMARVEISLEPSLKLPSDTGAAIVTAGMLGDRYIELKPGGGGRILKSGDEIAMTESAMVPEKLLGQSGGFTWHGPGTIKLFARFTETGDLNVRAPVVISGVRVGEVSKIELDPNDPHYRAMVYLALEPGLKLPTDTSASIVTAGMLGDRYIELSPGGDDTLLQSGDQISHTEPAMILEKVLGEVVYGLTKDNSKNDTNKPKAPASQH